MPDGRSAFTEKSIPSVLSDELFSSSRRQKSRPLRASAALRYRSIAVWISVTPAAPPNGFP